MWLSAAHIRLQGRTCCSSSEVGGLHILQSDQLNPTQATRNVRYECQLISDTRLFSVFVVTTLLCLVLLSGLVVLTSSSSSLKASQETSVARLGQTAGPIWPNGHWFTFQQQLRPSGMHSNWVWYPLSSFIIQLVHGNRPNLPSLYNLKDSIIEHFS